MERTHAVGGLTVGLLALVVAVSIAVALTARQPSAAIGVRSCSSTETGAGST